MISKQIVILEDFNNCQIISDVNFAFYKCPNTVVNITVVYGRYPDAPTNHCMFLQNPVVNSNFKNLNSLHISPTFSKQKQRTETYSYHHIFMFFRHDLSLHRRCLYIGQRKTRGNGGTNMKHGTKYGEARFLTKTPSNPICMTVLWNVWDFNENNFFASSVCQKESRKVSTLQFSK